MKRLWTPCKGNRRRISASVSGELSAGEKEQLRGHVAGCDSCRKYYDQIAEVAGSLAAWERNVAGIEPGKATLQRWAAEFAAADSHPQPRPVIRLSRVIEWCGDLIRPYRRTWAAMGGAWVILLFINLSGPHTSQTGSSRGPEPSAELVRAYLATSIHAAQLTKLPDWQN